MNNYQQTLYDRMKQQFDDWFGQPDTTVSGQEVYRFLHSLSGTAGTIGLHQLSAAARSLVDSLHEDEEAAQWERTELQRFLQPLTEVSQGVMASAGMNGMSTEVADEKPTVVLVMDRDEPVLQRLKEKLGRYGYIVAETDSAELAVQQYHSLGPDCLVLDHLSGGLDVLVALEDQLQEQPVPVTIISAEDDAATRIQAYRLGADDYLVKPLQLSVLTAVLERQLAKKRQIEKLLGTDELTGALRQPMLEEVYDAQLLQAGATGRPFGMVLITMERLEGIRARYSDLPAEETLQTVAAWLMDKTVYESGGKVIRYRWDSFVLLLPDLAIDESTKLAACWRRELAELPHVKEQPLQVIAGAVAVDEPDRPLDYWLAKLREAVAAEGLASAERYQRK